jgi:hypothetical protein
MGGFGKGRRVKRMGGKEKSPALATLKVRSPVIFQGKQSSV